MGHFITAITVLLLITLPASAGFDMPSRIETRKDQEQLASNIIVGRVIGYRLIRPADSQPPLNLYSVEVQVTKVEKGETLSSDQTVTISFHSELNEFDLNCSRRPIVGCSTSTSQWAPYPSELARIYLLAKPDSSYVADYPSGVVAIDDFLSSEQVKAYLKSGKTPARFWSLPLVAGLAASIGTILLLYTLIRKRRATLVPG